MKDYFEYDEENVQMSDLYHLYYMKKEKCTDVELPQIVRTAQKRVLR